MQVDVVPSKEVSENISSGLLPPPAGGFGGSWPPFQQGIWCGVRRGCAAAQEQQRQQWRQQAGRRQQRAAVEPGLLSGPVPSPAQQAKACSPAAVVECEPDLRFIYLTVSEDFGVMLGGRGPFILSRLPNLYVGARGTVSLCCGPIGFAWPLQQCCVATTYA